MLSDSGQKITPLALPPFGRVEDEHGMSYGMSYYAIPMPAPNVSLLQRQSLGQPILRRRWQNSHYRLRVPISWTGVRELDYPFFKGSATVQTNSAVRRTPRPDIQKRSFFTPGTASGAGMAPMRRFGKALPLPIQTFNVPVYGDYSGEGVSV